MKETHAEQKGFQFTGIYGRNKEEIKLKLNKIIRDGYQAMLCIVPDSLLSRGAVGVGFSIFAEPKYFDDLKAKNLQTRIEKSSTILKQIKDKFDADCLEEENLINSHIMWLKEHGYKNPLDFVVK
jgi:hypothetical protein